MIEFTFSTPTLVARARSCEHLKSGAERAAVDFVFDGNSVFTHVANWTDAAERGAVAQHLGTLTGLDVGTVETDLARFEREILSAHYRNEVWAETNVAFKTAKEIAEETPVQVDWVAHGLVARGAVTELDGKIKAAGKTTFATHMAHQVVLGGLFLEKPTTQGPVVYLTEQGATSFREALRRADLLERDDFHVLFWHEVVGMPWPDVVNFAVEYALRIGAVLLVVDTLSQFAGVRGDAENNSGEALAAMEPLQEAAARHNLGVMALRHERKAGGAVGDSARGSSAFGGAVDIVLSLRRPEGQHNPGVREIQSLSRFDETPDGLMIELELGCYQVLGSEDDLKFRKAKADLLEVMPVGEAEALPEKDLRDKVDLKRSTSQRALDALQNEGTIRRIGAGKRGDPYRYFRPDEDGSDDVDESEIPGFLSAQTSSLYGQKEIEADSAPPAEDVESF